MNKDRHFELQPLASKLVGKVMTSQSNSIATLEFSGKKSQPAKKVRVKV
jgi:hypothetical protein